MTSISVGKIGKIGEKHLTDSGGWDNYEAQRTGPP
jgi:hypothetical protein